MKNKTINTTHAKLALFAVLGLLTIANFHGNQIKKQGEVEFASIKSDINSEKLYEKKIVSELNGNDIKKNNEVSKKLNKSLTKTHNEITKKEIINE